MTLGCGRAILGEWLSELGGVAERPCESGRATLEEWKSELVGVARRPGGGEWQSDLGEGLRDLEWGIECLAEQSGGCI